MKKFIVSLLRKAGSIIPNIRFIRAIPNRILKPIHLMLKLGDGVVDVFDFKMKLDPRECVDGMLWFAPHLYECSEIQFLKNCFSYNSEGWFVDVGSYKGFWSLYFASNFPRWRILSIEAHPIAYKILCKNIAINNFEKRIVPLHLGVADFTGKLPLYWENRGNLGGASFADFAKNRSHFVFVTVKPLALILEEQNIKKINLMKLDIEGFEFKVLSHFFSSANKRYWPLYLCVEFIHSSGIKELLEKFGYSLLLKTRQNLIFKLNHGERLNNHPNL